MQIFASDASHVVVAERIGHGGSIYQFKSGPVGGCQMKANVVECIGAEGSMYFSSQSEGCQVSGDGRNKVR